MAVTPGFVITQATTLLLIVLGALVLSVRPRTRASIAFAVYAMGAGAGIFASNLWQVSLQSEATRWVAMILQLVSGTALAVLLLSFPRPARRWEQATFWGGTLAILGFGLWSARSALASLQSSPAAILAPLALGAVVLAVRFGKESEKDARSQLALVSAGTLPYLAMQAGDQLARLDAWRTFPSLPHTLLLAAATVIWMVNAARVHGSTRAARNVAILIPASALLGMAARAWVGDGNIDDTAIYGIARIITFAVLSYAIVRHQLLGIDVKLRWTISKSTIAAAFIAAFFLASEGAQLVLGEENQWVGLLGAGALVFAMAPLQRAAERLAEHAVPMPTGPQAAPLDTPSDREAAYRRAVKLALRDRQLTREEEVHLLELAHHAGITPLQAARIHTEVEQEVRG